MDEHRLGLSILAVVSVLALTSFVLIQPSLTGLQFSANYEQPANNKPAIIQSSTYRTPYNLCQQFLCAYPGDMFYSENVPASPVGVDILTGNIRCGCPDGHEFFIRPDRIEEATY